MGFVYRRCYGYPLACSNALLGSLSIGFVYIFFFMKIGLKMTANYFLLLEKIIQNNSVLASTLVIPYGTNNWHNNFFRCFGFQFSALVSSFSVFGFGQEFSFRCIPTCNSLYLVKVHNDIYEAIGEGLYYARVEIRLVGHLMDALPGAFWPPGL